MIKYSKVTFKDGSTGVVMDREIEMLKKNDLIVGTPKPSAPSPVVNQPEPKKKKVEEKPSPKPVNIGKGSVKKG